MSGLTPKTFGTVFGAVYLIVGLLGFAVTGFDGFAATEGDTLILFELNPLHNIVHLLIGGALVVAARQGEAPARSMALLVGAVYAIVGLAGFAVAGTSANILALNVADHLLHLVTAAIAFVAVGASRQAPAAA